MTDYIDREAAKAAIVKAVGNGHSPYNAIVMLPAADVVERASGLIGEFPAADVRPVVYCKNCKHNMANIVDIQDGININENWNACQLTEMYDDVKPDDFCSRGARMGQDDEE